MSVWTNYVSNRWVDSWFTSSVTWHVMDQVNGQKIRRILGLSTNIIQWMIRNYTFLTWSNSIVSSEQNELVSISLTLDPDTVHCNAMLGQLVRNNQRCGSMINPNVLRVIRCWLLSKQTTPPR